MSARTGRSFGPVLLVARWSLRELLWSPRSLAMLLVAASPLGLALLYRLAMALQMAEPKAGFAAFSAMVTGASFPFVVPVLTLFYASGVVSDDLESGTLRYFLTRPVSRASFLTGKALASFSMASVLFLPFLVLSYYAFLAPAGFREVGRHFPSLLADLGAAAVGLAAYNGLFALAGTLLRRPLVAGLFFVFGWQAIATFVPGTIRLLTIAHYLNSLVPHPPLPGSLASLLGERSSATASILVLVGLAGVTHGLAIWAFSRKELP